MCNPSGNHLGFTLRPYLVWPLPTTSTGFPGSSDGKESASMKKAWVRFLGPEDPLEKEMATHSGILTWKIPWMEEPGRLQSIGLQRVGYIWAATLSFLLSLFLPPPPSPLWSEPPTSVVLVVVFSRSVVPGSYSAMDYSLPGSSVHGISQIRILEWLAISFSRGSSWPRNQTRVCCGRLSYLSLLIFGTLHSKGYIFPFLLFFLLLFTAICKASSDSHFAFLHFFFLGMVLIPVFYIVSWTSFHSSSGTLSIRSSPLNLFLASTV